MVEDCKACNLSIAFVGYDVLLWIIPYCVNVIAEFVGEMFVEYRRLFAKRTILLIIAVIFLCFDFIPYI